MLLALLSSSSVNDTEQSKSPWIGFPLLGLTASLKVQVAFFSISPVFAKNNITFIVIFVFACNLLLTKAAKKKLKPLLIFLIVLTCLKEISTSTFSSTSFNLPLPHSMSLISKLGKINNSFVPSLIIVCSINKDSVKSLSKVQSNVSLSKEQVIETPSGYVNGIVNFVAIDVSSVNDPLINNFPELLHSLWSSLSITKVGGTTAFTPSITSLFSIAWSVKTGFKATSSSVGTPAISSELLNLKEV